MAIKLPRALAIVASSYARRHLEPAYDALLSNDKAAALLASLSSGQKQAIELALHSSTAVIDAAMPENSPLTVFLKAILSDAGPELARRLEVPTPTPTPSQHGETIEGHVLHKIVHPRPGDPA